jgi:parvulin-like peptidyl-prolyl isomerase
MRLILLLAGNLLAAGCAAPATVRALPERPDQAGPPRGAPGDGGGGGAVAIAAEVNGEPITRRDLDEELTLDHDWVQMQRGGAGKGGEALRRKIKERALDALIDDILITQAAKKKKVTLSPEEEKEFERRFEERIKEDWGSVEAFDEYLKDRGVPLARQKAQVRNHFIMQKLVDQETLRADGFVRPADIRAYYEAHREEYREPGQVVFAEIDFKLATHSPEEARASADEALRAIQAGSDFAEVARARSEGAHKESGGEFKVESVDALRDKEVADALKKLKPGEVSGALATARAITIVKLIAVREESYRRFEDVEEEIDRKLDDLKRTERHRELLQRLRAEATIKISPDALK